MFKSSMLWPTTITLVLLFAQGEELFSKNCTEKYSARVMTVSTMYTIEKYQSRCNLWGFFGNCTRTRIRAVSRITYVMEEKERMSCCKGSIALNDTTCTTECPKGRYGAGCVKKCPCSTTGNWKCDIMTGNCSCDNGYQGRACDEACATGFFGPKCANKCRCYGQSLCSHVDGSCNCTSPGWTGQYCSKRCPIGYFGQGCSENCQCHRNNTMSCDHINGKCSCTSADFTGQYCQERNRTDTGDDNRQNAAASSGGVTQERNLYLSISVSVGGTLLAVICAVLLVVCLYKKKQRERDRRETYVTAADIMYVTSKNVYDAPQHYAELTVKTGEVKSVEYSC